MADQINRVSTKKPPRLGAKWDWGQLVFIAVCRHGATGRGRFGGGGDKEAQRRAVLYFFIFFALLYVY